MESTGSLEQLFAWVFAVLAAVMLLAPTMMAALGVGFAAVGATLAVRTDSRVPMWVSLIAGGLLLLALIGYLS